MSIPVILHFGAHKTGTSLIQKFMRDRRRMMRKNGVAFLRRSNGDRFIGWADGEDLASRISKVSQRIYVAQLLGRKAYVVSHENSIGRPFDSDLQGLYPHAAARSKSIVEKLGNKDLFAVFYIRSQASFIESYYLQTIHEGGHENFREWSQPKIEGSLSWRSTYDALCAALGKERVLLKYFDDEIGKGQADFLRDFFSSFMEVNSTRFEDFSYPALRNPSIGDLGLEIALQINPHLENRTQKKTIRKFLQENFSNSRFPRPILLSDAEKKLLTTRYQTENSELIAESRAHFVAPHHLTA